MTRPSAEHDPAVRSHVGTRIPIRKGLFLLEGDDLRLVGGFSPTSGRHHFPRAPVCPYTGADDVDDVVLSAEGSLWAWTAITTPPPGYEGSTPYGFGVVELPEGLRVVTRLTEPDPARLEVGQAMKLVADPVFVDDDGREVVTWAFAPQVATA